MTSHIGVVVCSAEGAALCFRTVCAEGAALLGPHGHPEITLHTFSLATYVEAIERNDWQAVGELMLASANKLARAGADFLTIRIRRCPHWTRRACSRAQRSGAPSRVRPGRRSCYA